MVKSIYLIIIRGLILIRDEQCKFDISFAITSIVRGLRFGVRVISVGQSIAQNVS